MFSASSQAAPVPPSGAKVIATGTEISVHTNETIDSSQSTEGQTYSAQISEDVEDVNVALPFAMAIPALLVVRKVAGWGQEYAARNWFSDLYSVTCDGKTFNVFSSDVDESNGKGVGKNRRTAEFLGGGAALGASSEAFSAAAEALELALPAERVVAFSLRF